MTEAEIQRDVLSYLRRRGLLHARTNAGRKGGVRLAPAGWPDVVGMYKGHFFGLEIKAKDGVVSAEQWATLLRIRDEGGYAGVVHSVEEVSRLLS